MRLTALVLPVFARRAAVAACKRQRPGDENIRRAHELVATKPSAAIIEYERAGKAGANAVEVAKGLAAAYEGLHEFDKARALLREIVAKKSDDLDARLGLARMEMLDLHIDSTRQELEAVLGLRPPHTPSLLLYAALARTASQGKTGLQLLDGLDAKSFAPLIRSAEYAFARACLIAAMGDAVRAEAVLAEAASSTALDPKSALGLANAGRATNKLRLAEWLLARASDTKGADEQVHEALAEVALSQRHFPLAKTAISRLRTEFRPDPHALLLLARYHELQHQPIETAQVTRRALDAAAESDLAERRRVAIAHATALARSGNVLDAAKLLSELLQSEPEFSPALLLLADLRLGQKQLDDAIELAGKLEKDEQLRTAAFQILVAAQVRKGDLSAAEAAARRFVSVSSSSPDSVMLLVNLLIHEKRGSLALRELESSLARSPNQIDLIAARIGMTERVLGFAKAESIALEAAQSKHPRLVRELARLYERNGRLESAIKTYRDLAGSDVLALGDLSQLQSRIGNTGAALAAMRELVQLDPYNVDALLRLGMLEMGAGQAETARQMYERALGIDPDSVPALNNLATILAGVQGEAERAVSLARRAYALAIGDPRVADTLGWALVRNHGEEPSEAVRLLQSSAMVLRTPESEYHYGAALAVAGRFDEAAGVLDRALGAAGSPAWQSEAAAVRDEVRKALEETSKQ